MRNRRILREITIFVLAITLFVAYVVVAGGMYNGTL